MNANDVSERVRRYFRVKANQLAAVADLPVCQHSGLIGGHREELQRIYLGEILPKRFSVSRGMVYGPFHRSHEADIVIWDAQNYPSLPMLDHSFFFADSVRAVLESKSLWNKAEFEDVLKKCQAVRDIVPMTTSSNLSDKLAQIWQAIEALHTGIEHHGMMISRHHISTAAIFLRGGDSLTSEFLTAHMVSEIDDAWPDVMLLLSPGRVIIKNYYSEPGQYMGGSGSLDFYDIGEDALLLFTTALLALVTERSVQVEDPLYLVKYVPELTDVQPIASIQFPLTRPVPHRMPLWDRS